MSALMPGYHAACPGLHSAVAVVQGGQDATAKSGRNNNSGPVTGGGVPHSTQYRFWCSVQYGCSVGWRGPVAGQSLLDVLRELPVDGVVVARRQSSSVAGLPSVAVVAGDSTAPEVTMLDGEAGLGVRGDVASGRVARWAA